MKAWQLLNDESKWTKGARAKDANGIIVDPKSAEACQWCLYGALDRVGDDGYTVIKIIDKVGSVATWNDAPERTFQEVHNLLKELDI